MQMLDRRRRHGGGRTASPRQLQQRPANTPNLIPWSRGVLRQNNECGLSRRSLGEGGSVLDIRDRGMRKLWREGTYFTDSKTKLSNQNLTPKMLNRSVFNLKRRDDMKWHNYCFSYNHSQIHNQLSCGFQLVMSMKQSTFHEEKNEKTLHDLLRINLFTAGMFRFWIRNNQN